MTGQIRVGNAGMYHRGALHPQAMKPRVEWAAQWLRAYGITGIAATGSGLVFAGACSLVTGIPVVMVRRKDEKPLTPGGSTVVYSGAWDKTNWAWVDDCLSAGRTLGWALQELSRVKEAWRRVVSPREVDDFAPMWLPSLVVLYDDASYDPEGTGERRNKVREVVFPYSELAIPCVGADDCFSLLG